MATGIVLASTQPAKGTDATVGLTILALLLALTLGFSAADIQRERTTEATSATATETVQPLLDGRGKWGGYL